MEKVTMYRCEYCGNLFDTAELSAKHEQRHRNIDGVKCYTNVVTVMANKI